MTHGWRDRWLNDDGRRLAEEVFARLLAGEQLDGLGLGEYGGRIDLRGLPAPPAKRLRRYEKLGFFIEDLGDLIEFEGVRLEGLDLSDSVLEHLRFFHTIVADCRFVGARCIDWRLWAVDIVDTTFDGADLRGSGLGAWYEGRGNVFRRVDFTNADLREIACPEATFVDCDFSHARLDKVEFGGSSFVRCRFAGRLREVMFYDRDFEAQKPEPNPMEDVDFSGAELIYVDFRNLDLRRVRLPTSGNHIILRHYPCVLRRAARELEGDERDIALGLLGLVENDLQWVPKRRQVGIFHREIFEKYGRDEAHWAETFLRALESECAELDRRSTLRGGITRLLGRQR